MLPYCGVIEPLKAYEAIKKHDEDLLYKKTPQLEIGSYGDGPIEVDCSSGKIIGEQQQQLQQVSSSNNNGCMEYSREDVQRHNSRDDCWYALYGKIWDMTSYLNKHKGGAGVMLPYCGAIEPLKAYEAIKKHDEDLLYKKTPELEIGRLGETTQQVDC